MFSVRRLAVFAYLGVKVVLLPSSIAIAADSPWMLATTKSEGAPIRKTPELTAPMIGTLPGKSQIWVSKSLQDGFYSTYLRTPIAGVQTAWVSEKAVIVANAQANAHTVRTDRAVASESKATGPRFSGQLVAGAPSIISYSVGGKTTSIPNASVSSNGLYFGGRAGYLLTANSSGAGLQLSLGGSLIYIFPASTYSFPLLFSGFGEFAYRGPSRFTPIIRGEYEALGLPYPYVSKTGSTVYETLNTSLFWAGAGLQYETQSVSHNLKFAFTGAYSVASSSSTSLTSLSFKNPGFKLGLSTDYQLVDILCIGGKFNYLNLTGDLSISGYAAEVTFGIQF